MGTLTNDTTNAPKRTETALVLMHIKPIKFSSRLYQINQADMDTTIKRFALSASLSPPGLRSLWQIQGTLSLSVLGILV